MDLLASSSGSVPVAATRKVVRTLAMRRQFWGWVAFCLPFVLLLLGALLEAVAELDDTTNGWTPTYMLSLMGGERGVPGGRGGIVKVSRLIVQLESRS
jgi:hypothetical protein